LQTRNTIVPFAEALTQFLHCLVQFLHLLASFLINLPPSQNLLLHFLVCFLFF